MVMLKLETVTRVTIVKKVTTFGAANHVTM